VNERREVGSPYHINRLTRQFLAKPLRSQTTVRATICAVAKGKNTFLRKGGESIKAYDVVKALVDGLAENQARVHITAFGRGVASLCSVLESTNRNTKTGKSAFWSLEAGAWSLPTTGIPPCKVMDCPDGKAYS
jgi:hypothetical protein